MVDFSRKNIRVNMNVLNNSVESDSYYIDDLLEGALPANLIDQKLINATYANEIKKLLLLISISDISRGIINLESKINKLENFVNVDLEIPNLTKFYETLSPVFLQTFVESEAVDDLEILNTAWLEAIRISLEEELTIWQEKTAFS